jgi:hypothetical protein
MKNNQLFETSWAGPISKSFLNYSNSLKKSKVKNPINSNLYRALAKILHGTRPS